MKFNELEIGKKYFIDNMKTVGTLVKGKYGNGFRVDEPHYFAADDDGLVRFAEDIHFEYKEVYSYST